VTDPFPAWFHAQSTNFFLTRHACNYTQHALGFCCLLGRDGGRQDHYLFGDGTQPDKVAMREGIQYADGARGADCRIGSKAGQRGDGDGESEGMMVVCKPQVVGDGEKAHETESRESSNVQVTQIGIFEPSEGMCEASPSSTFSSLSLTTLAPFLHLSLYPL
jgi:hypothetical protein